MPPKDIHTRIALLEARIAKLEGIKRKARELKTNIKKKGDQKKAKAIADSLKR